MKRLAGLLAMVLFCALHAGGGGTGKMAMEDIAFISSVDGTEQKYVVLLPDGDGDDPPGDILIALHGHGSDRWQFVKDARDECRAARDVAAEHGMIFVSPDYRATTSWMGPKAEADLVQIIAELKARRPSARIFLCGGSMGGAGSLTFAALHPELIAGVASMNGTANLLEFENFQPAIAASFGGTKASAPHEYEKRSAEFHAQAMTMPVGMTAGGKDNSVPPQSVRRLAEALEALERPVRLIFREDGGHATTYDDAKAILEFVVQAAAAAR